MPPRLITVSGDGRIKVKPDTASLNLGVQATGRTATDALTKANTSAAAVIAAVKAAGVDDNDIATSGLSIYPQYNPTGVAIAGYQASNDVTVIVRDIATTGSLIDAAAGSAGEHITVGGVSFYVDDVEAVIGEARINAINNARKRADEYAAAAGAVVGSVVQISEASIGYPMPQTLRAESMAKFSSGGSPTPVEAGMQVLAVSITVVYELN